MELLQRYDLLERIAAGGMGQVFMARASGERGFQKTVAVKRILPDLASDPEFVVRFVAEAKLAVSLSHANIVQVFDLARAGDELFLVMEFVEGADLGKLVAALAAQGEKIPVGIALHVAIGALKGLAYAHDRIDADGNPCGVVHCDISPSNLLVSYAGEVKIVDFGVAQALSRAQKRRPDARVVGKYRYMAPEVLRREALDARTDLYSLAVVLHELIGGRRVFDGEDTPQVVRAVLAGQKARLRDDRPDVPPALDALVARGMAANAARRPPTARSMLAEMTEIALQLRPPVTDPEVGAWTRRLVPSRVPQASSRLERALRHLQGAGRQARTATISASAPSPALSFLAHATEDGTTVWERVPSGSQTRPRRRSGALALASLALLLLAGVGVVAAQHSSLWEKSRPTAAPTPIAPAPTPIAPAPTPMALAPAPTTPAPAPTAAPAPTPAVTAPVTAPAPPPARARPRAARMGYVNVYAEPWAYVLVDGRNVGPTPLMKLPLPAGRHRVSLRHPSLPTRDKVVHVVAGQIQLIDVKLTP